MSYIYIWLEPGCLDFQSSGLDSAKGFQSVINSHQRMVSSSVKAPSSFHLLVLRCTAADRSSHRREHFDFSAKGFSFLSGGTISGSRL